MRTNKIVCIIYLFSSVLTYGAFGAGKSSPEANSYNIAKVTLREMKDKDFGRTPHRVGKGNVFFDKFESVSVNLPEAEQGEILNVEWKAYRVSSAGEKIRLHIEYRTIEDATVKTKDIDIAVDKTGLYETPVEHLGEEFKKEGSIESWKVSLMAGNVVHDHEVSPTWSEPTQ